MKEPTPKEKYTYLPAEVRKEVLKKTISVQDAKSIAKILDKELRLEAMKIIKRQLSTKKFILKEAMDITEGRTKPQTKVFISPEERLMKQFAQIHKQVTMKMHLRLVNSYDEETRDILTGYMRNILLHLIHEFKNDKSIVAKMKFLPDNIIDIQENK